MNILQTHFANVEVLFAVILSVGLYNSSVVYGRNVMGKSIVNIQGNKYIEYSYLPNRRTLLIVQKIQAPHSY